MDVLFAMTMHMRNKGEFYIAIYTHESHVHILGENHISVLFWLSYD